MYVTYLVSVAPNSLSNSGVSKTILRRPTWDT